MREPTRPETPDFELLFESAPDLYLVLTPDLNIVAASDAYLAATMTERSQIVGRALFAVFPDNPDDPVATGVDNLRSSLERVLRLRRPDAMAVQKYDVRRSGGDEFEERYWSPVNYPVLGRDGAIAYIVHRVEDVTDFVRSRAASSARESEDDVRARAAAMGADVYRRAQQLQEANRELRGLHAILEAQIQARTTDVERAKTELEREMARRHITETALRRAEEQFRQAQKLEAVGRLAGGVAHDFNNLLSVIMVYSESLIEDLGPEHSGRSGLEEIRRAGERAADLTRQLLAFSRQQVLEPRVVDLNDVLGGFERMLRRVLGEDVELRIARATDLGHIKADPGQIEQILMNLVVNARDAMPDGGTLSIATGNVELSQEYAEEHLGTSAGSYVILTVSDTGVGMDKATQARVFEPFFTTKPRGKGTGLGLSTVFGIVKQSGGAIWLYSEPSVGTTFKLYFPRTDDQVSGATSTQAMEHAKRTETILLVEDEEQLRRPAAAILEKAGYLVLSAGNAEEALRICARHPGPIHLLLTDVIMPGVHGRQLAERATELRPDMRVLYMSGYTDDVIAHHGVLDAGVSFLQKPITSKTLNAKVREVLDSAS